jgi:hypothetical protein
MLGYLHRLRKRMAYRGLTQDDELLQALQCAEMTMYDLHIAFHYLSSGDTVGGLPNAYEMSRSILAAHATLTIILVRCSQGYAFLRGDLIYEISKLPYCD